VYEKKIKRLEKTQGHSKKTSITNKVGIKRRKTYRWMLIACSNDFIRLFRNKQHHRNYLAGVIHKNLVVMKVV